MEFINSWVHEKDLLLIFENKILNGGNAQTFKYITLFCMLFTTKKKSIVQLCYTIYIFQAALGKLSWLNVHDTFGEIRKT